MPQEASVAAESFKDVVASRFEKFTSEVFSPRMAGFALSRVWVYVVFFNGALLLNKSNAGITMDFVYLLSLVALVALLIVAGIGYRASERISQTSYGRAAPAILSVLGTSALPFASMNETAGVAMIVLAAVATGFGSGLFCLFWGKVYGHAGGSVTIGDATAAFVIASLPVPLFIVLPFPVQIALVTLLPIGSALVLSRELDRVDAERAEERQEGAASTAESPDKAAPRHEGKGPAVDSAADASWSLEVVNLSWKKVIAKLVASSLVFGCVISLMRTTSAGTGVGAMNDPLNTVLPYVSLIVGVITLLLLLLSRQLDLAYTYKPVLILMMIGCIMLPFTGRANLPAHAVTMGGYICFEIMNWAILSDISFRFNIPACRVYGFGRAATSGGVLLGALIGLYLNRNVVFTSEILTALAFALIFAMVITYTFTLTERDVAKITRQRRRHPVQHSGNAEAPEPRRELTIDEKAELLAAEHDITGRSLEVLVLLAKGNSAARIEQELYMSKGTVNTHTRRLYQKLGVHKRQELIDMVDAVEDDIEI